MATMLARRPRLTRQFTAWYETSQCTDLYTPPYSADVCKCWCSTLVNAPADMQHNDITLSGRCAVILSNDKHRRSLELKCQSAVSICSSTGHSAGERCACGAQPDNDRGGSCFKSKTGYACPAGRAAMELTALQAFLSSNAT
jgi:hypothetical protein